ncbi:MAG: hypothetical protein Q8Q31_05095 [Nanoarchaeota archaeon]|nr:hypothetical protein [Nanoarchaeota archaeon]
MEIEVLDHHFTKAGYAQGKPLGWQSVAWSQGLDAFLDEERSTVSRNNIEHFLLNPSVIVRGVKEVLGCEDIKLGEKKVWVLQRLQNIKPHKEDSRQNFYLTNALVSDEDMARLGYNVPLLFETKELFQKPYLDADGYLQEGDFPKITESRTVKVREGMRKGPAIEDSVRDRIVAELDKEYSKYFPLNIIIQRAEDILPIMNSLTPYAEGNKKAITFWGPSCAGASTLKHRRNIYFFTSDNQQLAKEYDPNMQRGGLIDLTA